MGITHASKMAVIVTVNIEIRYRCTWADRIRKTKVNVYIWSHPNNCCVQGSLLPGCFRSLKWENLIKNGSKTDWFACFCLNPRGREVWTSRNSLWVEGWELNLKLDTPVSFCIFYSDLPLLNQVFKWVSDFSRQRKATRCGVQRKICSIHNIQTLYYTEISVPPYWYKKWSDADRDTLRLHWHVLTLILVLVIHHVVYTMESRLRTFYSHKSLVY